MREFGSGILGCIICVLALMGSILGGFCLGVEGDIREVTNFDYKTDLTGTFATDTAPEYIDYSPAANFMGYSRSSVDYSRTNVANAYKYIVSYPNDTTIDSVTIRNTDFLASSDDFLISSPNTQLVLNVTGGGYNYGTAKTSAGITYNVFCNTTSITGAPNIPKVAGLYPILDPYRSYAHIIEIDIANSGDHPLLLTTTTLTQASLSDETNKSWSIFSASLNSHPTRIEWDTYIDDVSVYSGSTLLFTEKLNKILVYYTYQYNAGGTPAQANINATLTIAARNAITDSIEESDSFPSLGQIWIGINNVSANRGYPTTPTTSYHGHDFNVAVDGRTDATTLSSILSSTSGISTNNQLEIQPYYFSNSWSDVIVINKSDVTYISGVNFITTTTDANFPNKITYNNGSCTVYYNNGSSSWTANASDIIVVYGARDKDSNQYNVWTNFTYVWYTYSYLTINNNSNLANSNAFGSSNMSSSVLIRWDGSINMGIDRTYAGIQYNLSIPRINEKPNVSTLYKVLENMGIEYFSAIDLTLTYNTSPVLFYAGDFTRTDLTIGNSTQYIYTATMNENNSMPDRIVVTSGTAQLFKNNVLIATKSIDKVYVINNSLYKLSAIGNPSVRGSSVTFDGTATTDSAPVSLTVDNSSSYPSDGYTFSLPNADHPGSPVYMRPLLQYTGTQFSNMGDSVTFNAINKTANIILSNGELADTTYYLTKFRNFLNDIGMSTYESVDLSITYGTHPLIFIRGSWDYYFSHQTYHDQGGTVHYYYNYYWQSIDDSAFPDRITVDKATYRVHAYKNGTEIWAENADSLQVAYKYWTLENLGAYNAFNADEVTNQSMTAQGSGKLTPTYAYADPTKGVVLHTPFTEWSNGYKNNEINITVTKQNWSNNDLTVSAGTSSITIERRSAGGLYVTVNKYDGTTETRNMGNWYSAQVTINASEGWVAVTPIAGTGMPNFTRAVDLGDTTVFWNNWYNEGDIETLTFSTTDTSMRWAVTETSVFLNTYGIVMNNPSIDVTEYFPEMDEWRLNFFSFALIGDSMTVNNQTFPVNTATQTITVTGENGNTVSGELTNVYITQADNHTYFNFANSNKTVDLGETVSNTVSFGGLWYFTTGLFEVTQGTEKFYDWHLDGNLHATIPQICLMFIGILIAALILCKAILRMEIGAIDWIILICAAVISLIVAGGNL